MKKKKNRVITTIQYPVQLVRPVSHFLGQQLKCLEKTKKEIVRDDPFKNTDRISDNAAPDADAEEQFGHARTTAIKEQLDRKIIQTLRALARVRIGQYGICEECGRLINTDRLMAKPEATLCVHCESKREAK